MTSRNQVVRSYWKGKIVVGVGILASAFCVLFVWPSILHSFFHRQDEVRTVYLAPPGEYGPCKRAPVPNCVNYDQADAVMAFRFPRSMYGSKEPVWDTFGLNIYANEKIVAPFGAVPDDIRLQIPNMLGNVHPSLTIGIQNKRNTLPISASQILLNINKSKGDGYVIAKSWLSGFVMLDKKTCLDFDEAQFDNTDPRSRQDPRIMECLQRDQFFIPEDGTPTTFTCASRVKFKGQFTVPYCFVSSSRTDVGFGQSYLISSKYLANGYWRELDRRLFQFVLSHQTKVK
jgi:hypothetical protein